MGNHPGRSGRFEVSINCRGMGEDWRTQVALILADAARTLPDTAGYAGTERSLCDVNGNRVGAWRYRAGSARL